MDRHLKKLQEEIASAIAGMSVEQLSWHPPGKWCTAEVLEHLYLTRTGTTKGFSRVLQAGKPTARASTRRDHGRKLVVLGFGYLPPGRKAPAVARPRGLPIEKVPAEIGAKIGEMDDTISVCEQKLGRGKLFGSSNPGAAHGGAVEEVSSGAWKASCEADSAAAERRRVEQSELMCTPGRSAAEGQGAELPVS